MEAKEGPSNSNGESAESLQCSDLFSPDNLIATCEPDPDKQNGIPKNIVKLEYSNLENILRTAFEKSRTTTSKYPITVLTISEDFLPADQPFIKELLIKLLITYLRQGKKAPENLDTLAISEDEEADSVAAAPGLYLWPTPFVSKLKFIYWIMYSSGNAPKELHDFAFAASNNITVSVNKLDPSAEDYLSRLYRRLKREIGETCFRMAKLPTGEDVSLRNLQDYLQWTADEFNMSPPKPHDRKLVPPDDPLPRQEPQTQQPAILYTIPDPKIISEQIPKEHQKSVQTQPEIPPKRDVPEPPAIRREAHIHPHHLKRPPVPNPKPKPKEIPAEAPKIIQHDPVNIIHETDLPPVSIPRDEPQIQPVIHSAAPIPRPRLQEFLKEAPIFVQNEPPKPAPKPDIPQSSPPSKETSLQPEIHTPAPAATPEPKFEEIPKEPPKIAQHEIPSLDITTCTPEQLCEIYQCASKLHSAEASISVWIENSLEGNTISDLLPSLETHLKNSDVHGILTEVQDLVQILHQFLIELHNMFDNYVCFAGEHDADQMTRFFHVAKGHAKQALQQKCHVHHQFTGSLLRKCSRKLMSLFEHDNDNIIQMEDMLAQEISRKILEAYQSRFKSYAQHQHYDKLDDIQKRIGSQCTKMMTRSLEYSGKLNSVQGQRAWELGRSLSHHFENIMENLPKPVKPITSGNTRAAVRKYVDLYAQQMEKVWPSFSDKTRQQRKQCHDELVALILKNAPEEPQVIEEIRLRLNSYFLYKNEYLEQSLEEDPKSPTTPSPKTSSTICIYLTPEGIRVGAITEKGNMYLLFGPQKYSYCPPFLLLTHTNQFVYGCDAVRMTKEDRSTILSKGTVIHYATNSTENEIISRRILRDLFVNLKYQAERVLGTGEKYDRVLVIVPTWFDHENRGRIRDGCKMARFSRTFVLTEAPLAAQMILSKPEYSGQFGVVMSLTESHVEVRVYRTTDKHKVVIGLYAISQVPVPDLRKRLYFGDDLEDLIHLAYDKAADQIGDKDRIQICAEIIECDEWRLPFERFLERRRQDIMSFKKYIRDDNDTLNAVMELSRIPEEIGFFMFDHGMDVEVGKDEGLAGGDKHLVLSKVTENDIMTSMRNELSEKCERIREEVESGRVRLGVLSKKLVMGSLDGAEDTVRNDDATMEDLEGQQKEVDELIGQYNFAR